MKQSGRSTQALCFRTPAALKGTIFCGNTQNCAEMTLDSPVCTGSAVELF